MKNFFVSYKNPLTVVLTLLIMGGIFAYTKLQTSLFPEITFPKIKIIADAGQQPVNKMMVTVTKPLENAIKQVPDLHMIRSSTSRGSCEISAFMNWDANIDLGQQRIESKISAIKNLLPPDLQITVEKMNPSILPVMGYTLESNSKSAIELRQIAMYTVKPYLSQVDGVSEIRISGGKQKAPAQQGENDYPVYNPRYPRRSPVAHQFCKIKWLPIRLPVPLPHRYRRRGAYHHRP
jgi:multidrug efflux pump subunit AcrB